MKTIFFTSVLLVISVISVVSCKKETNAGGNETARLQVYLMDGPGDYEAVYIDVKDVMINMSSDNDDGWQSLSGVHAGVYDLLKLVNDDDTLLVDATIPTGRIHQIRLILGTENYVKIEGTSQLIKLETPSGQQSGLKLNIQEDVTGGILYTITMDFEVSQSIVKTGNSKYMLKPVIRTILNAVGGSLKGIVMPKSFQTSVKAISGVDTVASTYTDSDGGYLIKGLPAGTYSVFYQPSDNTYMDSLRTNISIQFSTVTKVDTTFLHQ